MLIMLRHPNAELQAVEMPDNTIAVCVPVYNTKDLDFEVEDGVEVDLRLLQGLIPCKILIFEPTDQATTYNGRYARIFEWVDR